MNYKRGLDVAAALKNRKHFDFNAVCPQLQISEAREDDVKENENGQFMKQFEMQFKSCDDRVEQCNENKGKTAGLLYV